MPRTSFYNSKRFRIAGAVIGTICALLPVFAPAGVVLAQTAYGTSFYSSPVPQSQNTSFTATQPSNYTPSPNSVQPLNVINPATGIPAVGNSTGADPINPNNINAATGVQSVADTTGTNNTSQPTTPPGPAGGNIPSPVECTGVYSCVTSIIYFFAVSVPTTFAYITTTAFSAAVNWSLKSTSYSMDFVAAGWETTRDVANMAFLFIIIYIAISIMVQAGTAGNMQTLSRVILVALFINFSFFGTRVVIDLGNEAAVIIYNLLPGTAPDKTTGGFLGQIGAKDMSLNIMNALAPQTLLSDKAFSVSSAQASKDNDTFSTAIMKSVLFISLGVVITVVGVAFLVAAIHFVSRMALLWMLVIVSPLALVAYTIKGPDKYFSQWLHELISQAFYPFYFLGVYMLLLIFMAGLSDKQGIFSIALGSFNSTASAGGDFYLRLASTVGVMVLLTTLTVVIIKQAMKFAEEMGGRGGKTAMGIGDWVNKQVVGRYTGALRGAGRLAAEGAAAPYRWTAGAAALAGDKVLSRTWIGNTMAGAAVRGGLQKVAAAPEVLGLTSTQASRAGTEKRTKEYETGLKARADEEKRKKDLKVVNDAIAKAKAGRDLTDAEQEALAKVDPSLFGGGVPTLTRAVIGGNTALGVTPGAKELQTIAPYMSKEQVEAAKKSVRLSDADKKSISDTWKAGFDDLASYVAAGMASDSQKKKFQNINAEGMDNITQVKLEEILEHNDKAFTKRHMDLLEKSNRSEAEKEAIRTKQREVQARETIAELRAIHTALASTSDFGRIIPAVEDLLHAPAAHRDAAAQQARLVTSVELQNVKTEQQAFARKIRSKIVNGEDLSDKEKEEGLRLERVVENLQALAKHVVSLQEKK